MSEEVKICGFMGRCSEVRFEERLDNETKIAGYRDNDIDLVAMARWCQNYLANNPLPEHDWQCRFSFWGLHMPIFEPWPFMGKELPHLGLVDPIVEGDTDSRMDYAYIFMREIAGDYGAVKKAEEGVRRRILSYIGDDGLSWTHGVVYSVGEEQYKKGGWTSCWTTGKALYAQSELFRLTGESKHKELARKLFHGLRRLAVWDTGRAYYEGGASCWNGQWWDSIKRDLVPQVYPYVVEPMVRYWEITGDGEALEFARAFADGMLAGRPSDKIGKAMVLEDGSFDAHVHCNLHAISGVAHLGALIREPRYIEWARRVYEFLRNKGTDYGWFPEVIGNDPPNHNRHTEICLVADMTYTAVWLAEAGYPEYFDHAERYIRNMIRNAQFFVTDEYESLYRQIHSDKPEEKVEEQLGVMRQIQGAFVSCPTPNDLVDENLEHHGVAGNPPMLLDMMGCCHPEGMRALHTAWRHTVTKKGEDIYINMSLSCKHKEAEVKTSLSDKGELVVRARAEGNYFLRPPVWAPRQKVKLYRSGTEESPNWKGDYIRVAVVKADEKISISYPLVSFIQEIELDAGYNSGTYAIKWQGNTVTEIQPEGKHMPLFQRPPIPPTLAIHES